MKHNIAVIGLSTMGSNLALNIADHGFQVSVYNRNPKVTEEFLNNHKHENIEGFHELHQLCDSLETPRRIILMIKAGNPIDEMISKLLPYLEKDDIIIDGGNSYFKDTMRRFDELKKQHIRYMGTGISGGEKGARNGPSIMPGGSLEAYSYVKDILEAISAHADGEPCCTFIGENGAGHYVKMVHNGIEYADMQLISEAYLLLKNIAKLTNQEMSEIFEAWDKQELQSYLIRITAAILKEKDPHSVHELVDMIVDKAAQKGTGKWTNLEAIDLGVDVSIITSALNMRYMSNQLTERIKGSELLKAPQHKKTQHIEAFIEDVRNSLYCGKIAAYAQGYKLLTTASKQYHWNLDLAAITKIFRAGCIIEARFLYDIADAYSRNPNLENLIFDEFFLYQINQKISSLRNIATLAIQNGQPSPALVNALSYFDTYRSTHIGANMIQAQRDYFGSHTFERIDQKGSYHHEWH